MTAIRCATLLAAALAWAAPATADERCLLSFESGVFDACSDRGQFADTPLTGLEGRTQGADAGYWAVKFEGPVGPRERAALQQLGAQVLDYLPHHAFRIALPAGTDPHGRIDGALWTGPVAPVWKLAGGLPELLGESARPAALPLSIGLNRGADSAALLQQWRQLDGVGHGFAVTGARSDRIVLSVEGAHLDALLVQLAPVAEVASIGLRKQMQFLNARAGWLHQSGVADQRPVFDQGLLGCGQVVGVLDSGVDFSHCAFADATLGDPPVSDCNDGSACLPGTPDPLQRKTAIYYKWSGAADALGDNACSSSTGAGHGTHVAGSITGNLASQPVDCASGTLGGTPGNLDGTAPGARLIAQEMGESLQYVNDLGGSIYHAAATAYANGARIHSNSWGGSCCFLGLFCLPGCSASYDEFARDADQATWEFPDLLIAIAAGNNGTCCAGSGGAVGSPGLAKSPLTVGASGAGSSGENAASFSSRGPTIDRRTKPDLMAQGDGIVSSASDGSTSVTGCATCTFSGTSMATPTAAGLAALVREYFNRGFHPGGSANAADAIATPSAALLKATLINGARDMTGTAVAAAAPNQVEGWGRLHLDDALYFAGDARRLWLHDDGTGVGTGESHSYDLEVAAGQPLKVTLAWSDHAAAIGANPHLVNRLRLEVQAPDGGVWTQKLPATGTPNPTQGTGSSDYDDRNVVHQLRFAAPAAGTWQLRVRGINVPMGAPGQPYALVATGDITVAAGGAQADLALTKTAVAGSVVVGTPLGWSITVGNAGPDAASDVAVVDSVPAGVTAIQAAGTGWTCAVTGQQVACTLDDPLPAGASSAALGITGTAPTLPGTVANSASVTAGTADPVPGNNLASADIQVTPVPVDLALAKTASAPSVVAGSAFTYQLAVSASGTGAEAVSLVDQLPAGVCLTAISAPGWTCALDQGELACSQPGPLAGAPAPVVLSVRAPMIGGAIENAALVAAANPDPDTGNNADSVTVTVVGAPADRIFAHDFDPAPDCL